MTFLHFNDSTIQIPITDRHVEFLRGKTCIDIWCYSLLFRFIPLRNAFFHNFATNKRRVQLKRFTS